MERIELIVDISRKILAVDGKPIKLEDDFTNAHISCEDSEEPILTLEYKRNYSEGPSYLEIEADKLMEEHGDKLFERLTMAGDPLGDEYLINFYGNINPVIKTIRFL